MCQEYLLPAIQLKVSKCRANKANHLCSLDATSTHTCTHTHAHKQHNGKVQQSATGNNKQLNNKSNSKNNKAQERANMRKVK